MHERRRVREVATIELGYQQIGGHVAVIGGHGPRHASALRWPTNVISTNQRAIQIDWANGIIRAPTYHALDPSADRTFAGRRGRRRDLRCAGREVPKRYPGSGRLPTPKRTASAFLVPINAGRL